MKRFTAIVFALRLILQAKSQGYIVPNGVTNIGYIFPGGYELDVLHDPANPAAGASYTGFLLHSVGKTPPTLYTNTFLFDPLVDPTGVRVFLISSNDPISLQPILAQSFTELVAGFNYVFTNGVPFYLGIYTGNDPNGPVNGIYSDPLFGWVELENFHGAIEFLDSALEYQGGGIYAGTQTIVPTPEPEALSLLAVSSLAFLLVKNRQRRRQFSK